MKKLFSTMIALAMLTATPLTVFATGSSSNTGGNTEIDVNGKYIEGNAATMISVDITWDDMSFEYNDGERTWDPNKHEYITSGGSWTNEKKTVNVKNHSNTAVKAEFSFASSLPNAAGSCTGWPGRDAGWIRCISNALTALLWSPLRMPSCWMR